MKSTLIRFTLAILCFLPGWEIRAQSPAARLEFDAASIRPAPPSAGPIRVSMAGDHGHINYSNVTVIALIRKAYGLRIYPLAVGPYPLSTDRYNVVAKAVGNASDEQTMQMLQALLADRFKLVVHRETRQLPIYALLAGKSGPKFHEVKDDGSAAQIDSGGEGHPIVARHISMKALAGTLQGYVGDPVHDLTGLTGIYDLKLEFTSDESLAANASAGPSVFTAVQEQLGLRLEARKGPVEVVVIDHVEKPSDN